MANTQAGRGLTLAKLLAIAGVFLVFHVISLVVERGRIPDTSQASFGDLSLVIIFEVLSWAAYPILAFCFLVLLETRGPTPTIFWATLGLCVLTELAYDFLRTGTLFDFASQTFAWSFLLCFVIFVAARRAGTGAQSGAGPGTGPGVESGAAAGKIAVVAVIIAALAWAVLGAVGSRFAGFFPGVIVILMFVVFYYLKGRENTMMMSAALIGATFGLAPAFGVIFLHYRAPLLREQPGLPPAAVLLVFPAALAAGTLAVPLLA
ncbi:hypothetical protein [Corynebacterium phocae]|uniref:hypothetical protein n=1 Tax=Corynebacterium phocae TaxID=161895 RepID=UPI000951744C|nr:hypothetical protein [Corynebacterium phocae]KAA8721588.1 hypothetical protein F4V58_10065 [Corynebacterium phocae]